MDVEKAVVEFGAEAVLRYRDMAETRHDNDVPESILRAHIAWRLHERFRCPVQVERLYAALALDLGMPLTTDLVSVLGGRRADLVVYREGRPSTIIELKIFDEASVLPSVDTDLYRARILARFAQAHLLLGVMICPVGGSLEARIERLHDALGGNMYVGERQASRDARWQWCFACASID